MSISGDRAIIGAYFDDIADGSGGTLRDAGSAYIITPSFVAASDTVYVDGKGAFGIGDLVQDNLGLSFSGTSLNIANGDSVDLSSLDADDQNLSLSGTTLNIEDGNSVDLSSLQDGGPDNLCNHTATPLHELSCFGWH